MGHPIPPEELERHREFLRSLARQLVWNDADADDLVQDAFAVAIQRPPSLVGNLSGWLATVLRHLSINRKRARTRRRDHEAEWIPEVEHTEPVDALNLLEAQHLVLDAVAELEEPHRSTITARFYEGLSLGQIAVRHGVSTRSVERAVDRGLAQLRSILRKRSGGDDSRWVPAVAQVSMMRAAREAGRSARVASRIGGRVALVAVAILVGVTVHRLMRTGEMAVASSGAAVAGTQGSTGHSAGFREPVAPVEVPAGSVRVVARWAEDGSPVQYVGVQAEPGGGSSSWFFQRGRTDEHGVALLSALGPGEAVVSLDRGEWTLTRIQKGQQSDVTLEIPRGVTVEGAVLNAQGEAVADAMVVRVEDRDGRPATHSLGKSDAAGRFRVRDVPPGASLSATADGYAPAKMQTVPENGAASTVQLDLHLIATGSSLRGIILGPDDRPVAGALVEAGPTTVMNVHQEGGKSAWRAAPTAVLAAESDDLGRFEIFGVRATTETPLVVRSPVYAAHHTSYPGARGCTSFALVRMKAAGILQGAVRDKRGSPQQGARVRAACECGEPAHVDVLSVGAITDKDGHYSLRLPVGDNTLIVEPPDGTALGASVLRCSVDEVTVRDIILPSDRSLRGRLQDPSGAPLSGLELQVSRHGEMPKFTKTAEDGRFVVPDCTHPPYSVLLLEHEHRDPFTLSDGVGPGAEELEWTVGRRGSFAGTFQDTGGRLPAGAKPEARLIQREGRLFLAEWDGSRFVFDDVTPGDYRVSILVKGEPRNTLYRSPWTTLHSGESFDFGNIRTERPGSLRVDLNGIRSGVGCLLRSTNHEISAYLTVGEQYAFSESLAPGEWLLDASGPGIARSITRISIRSGEATHETLLLERGTDRTLQFPVEAGRAWHSLRLRVLDAAGRLRAADVLEFSPLVREPGILLCLPVGTYDVFVEADGTLHAQGRFDVASMEPQSVALEFPLH